MNTKNAVAANPHKGVAAQMAQTGLISIGDLSLLTGVEVARLSNLTKRRVLKSYNEYHGKHFFDFGEILNWLYEPGSDDEVRIEIRAALEKEQQTTDCPYALSVVTAESGETSLQISWKDLIAA